MARQNPPVAFLIAFTIAAKLLVEAFFCKISAKRMDQEDRLRNWRTKVTGDLLSHPNVSIALLMMVVDVLTEGTLLFIALKTTIPPILIIIVFLSTQFLSAPIQGMVSDYFSQKNSLLFAISINTLAIAASAVLSSENPQNPSSLGNLLGLPSFSPEVLMISILCLKGALGNISVIARASIAEAIKFKTIKEI